ncbi:hypothetical protein OOU_Y34scaffold00088g7 [Pyricularia oryzae Y34]|uniref:Uncharacterized protein n=2 Tax=Pyricularia oryzae TaxID=318829 RepID=A0AA97PA07_PYRO3|nr:hypothetical protein OOU_Y34scaffold00088g7 [Pyricularia oryzae Y34]
MAAPPLHQSRFKRARAHISMGRSVQIA